MSDQQRHTITKNVTINGILKASALDISETRMYIHSQADFIVGAVIEIAFDIEGIPIHLKAMVQETQPGIGVEVQFLKMPPEQTARIRRFIKSIPDMAAEKSEEEKQKILLVDDSLQSRSLYKSKLNLAGFSVVEAKDGVEALKFLHDVKFTLVILDLWMEGVDGFKVLQLMKMNPQLKGIPVIVLSARSVPADIEKAIDLGARDFLPKMTTTPVKLVEKIKDILAAYQKEGGSKFIQRVIQ